MLKYFVSMPAYGARLPASRARAASCLDDAGGGAGEAATPFPSSIPAFTASAIQKKKKKDACETRMKIRIEKNGSKTLFPCPSNEFQCFPQFLPSFFLSFLPSPQMGERNEGRKGEWGRKQNHVFLIPHSLGPSGSGFSPFFLRISVMGRVTSIFGLTLAVVCFALFAVSASAENGLPGTVSLKIIKATHNLLYEAQSTSSEDEGWAKRVRQRNYFALLQRVREGLYPSAARAPGSDAAEHDVASGVRRSDASSSSTFTTMSTSTSIREKMLEDTPALSDDFALMSRKLLHSVPRVRGSNELPKVGR